MRGRRLDLELVTRGLARSRGQAKELVAAGIVRVDGTPAGKTSQQVDDASTISLDRAPEQWVGRAALKLLAALHHWGPGGTSLTRLGGIRALDPHGKRCLDVGASTGGFTQVLLEHGAAHVTALDVGRDQLVAALAADPRVRDLPETNVRDVAPGELGAPFEVVVADLSFISLALALPAMLPLVAPGGDLVVLVKPQFEVGRERLGHGGVVRSAREHRRVLYEVRDHAESLGLILLGAAPSPITGGDGNREFLYWLIRAEEVGRLSHSLVDNDMLDAIVRHASTEGAS